MTHIDSAVFLMVMYGMLLAPKFASAAIIIAHAKAVKLFGGRWAFSRAVLVELALSIAYAPILMIQQTRAVLRCIFARGNGWNPQQRNARAYPLGTLVRFHWVETLLGTLLLAGLMAGLVSWWLIPIMASLVLAVPLSALSATSAAMLRLDNPLTLREPTIVARARSARAAMRAQIEAADIAAE